MPPFHCFKQTNPPTHNIEFIRMMHIVARVIQPISTFHPPTLKTTPYTHTYIYIKRCNLQSFLVYVLGSRSARERKKKLLSKHTHPHTHRHCGEISVEISRAAASEGGYTTLSLSLRSLGGGGAAGGQ